MGLISRVSSRTYRKIVDIIPPIMSRSYSRSPSRSRSRSPVKNRSRSRSPREKSPEQTMHSIVVSDLPNDIRESELERKFEKFGKIGDVFMPKDRYSGKGRGFAFVRFYDKESQEDCVEGCKKDPIHFGGPDCRVDYAKSKPRPGSSDWDPEKAAQIRRERSDRMRGRYDDRRRGGYDDRRRDDRRGGYDDRRGGRDSYRDDRRERSRRSPSPYKRSERSPSPPK